MLDTFVNVRANPTTNLNVNAVSGTMTKTYRNSFFLRMHMKSDFAEDIFNVNPKMVYNGSYKNVIVIQIFIVGDMEVIVELMWKDDYDKIFEMIGELK